MPSGSLGSIDWTLWIAGALLSLVSITALVSATATLDPSLALKQAMWVGVGIGASVLVASVPYARWMDLAVLIYPLAVGALLFVLVAGTT
jgi:cell division protein FtsW (lipid II flippase)